MKNTFKLMIRNLLRKPVTTIINLIGLSVSLALVLILSTYSFSEFTTDQFHIKQKDIYLIQPGEDWLYTPGVLKPTIDNSLPFVENSIRIRNKWNAPIYQFNHNAPIESDLIFADKDFFKLFDYQALEGDLSTALSEPMSLVISQSLAQRLFGQESAVGKTIIMDDEHHLTIKAVMQNQKANTILSFNSITSIETMKMVQKSKGDLTNWRWSNYQTFVLLKNKAIPHEVKKAVIQSFPKEERSEYTKLKLLPLTKIYFSEIDDSISYIKMGSKPKVIYLTIVAILVMIIALVNFTNISSAQWQEKIKQTGIMKVIGAKRSSIIFNMLSETLLLFTSSLILAYFIIFITSPFLRITTEIFFNPNLLFTLNFISITLGTVVLLSFICGIIPALRIASSEILVNLKKRIVIRNSKSYGKGVLVTMQFVIAIVLILFTFLVQKQVDFGSNNLGINQENIVGIQMPDQLAKKKDVLKESLLSQASVDKVIFTQYYPGKMVSGWSSELQLDGTQKDVKYHTFSADAGFFDVMGLKLLSGRIYKDELETDTHKVIVNEQFLREYGINNPIGTIIPCGLNYEIIGVVKDFHFQAVNEPITPLVIRNDKYASIALIKLKTGNFNALHDAFVNIKRLASELSPAFPVRVTFFDQAVEHMYKSEVKFRKAFSLFAFCAIVICCMGILAMSIFTCQRRVKEIGIRKVNGAKTHEIISMLNKDFLKWVAIAFVIACPIAWYAMYKWLENFAYKTELSWWIFALAGLIAMGIALLTVSFQSWRAATRNPVESLRYE